jgi:hypothetical protein
LIRATYGGHIKQKGLSIPGKPFSIQQANPFGLIHAVLSKGMFSLVLIVI